MLTGWGGVPSGLMLDRGGGPRRLIFPYSCEFLKENTLLPHLCNFEKYYMFFFKLENIVES